MKFPNPFKRHFRILIGVLFFLLLSNSVFGQDNSIKFEEADENYVVVPNNPAINVTNNFTIEFWIELPRQIYTQAILQEGKCNNSSSSYNVVYRPDSTISFTFNCNGSCMFPNTYKTNTKLVPGICTHVAISYCADSIGIYFNGVKQPASFLEVGAGYCGNLVNSSEDLLIGTYLNYSDVFTLFFDGYMDELRIWSRIVPESEIIANMNTALSGDEPGLQMYYDFENTILGDGEMIENSALTGAVLNGTTHSLTASSPDNDHAGCFNESASLTTVNKNQKLTVFPNPATDLIHFSGDFLIDSDLHEIYVLDILGKVVLSETLTAEKNSVSVTHIQAGLYSYFILNPLDGNFFKGQFAVVK